MTSLQQSFLLLNIVLSLLIAWLSLRKAELPSARSLALLSLIVTFWSATYLFYDWQLFHFPTLFLISLNYLFSALAATALFIFSLTYSNHDKWVSRFTLILLGVQPVITQILFWVGSWRRMLFFEGGIYTSLQLSPFTGIWSNIHSVYLYNLEIASILLLTELFTRKPRNLLWKSGTVLAGSFVPLIFRLREVAGFITGEVIDYSLIGYSVAIVGLAYGIYRQSLVEVTPVTTDAVIDGMSDGWMVLDLNNNILDINPAAEKIVGMTRQSLYGKPFRSVLPDWVDISKATEDGKELEMRRSVRSGENWRYLNIRISNLRNKQGQPFGQLVVWRDITQRKLAEDARQRARDEMFVLLNAISNAASHSTSLDDFLADTIYQIIYPFESQVVAMLLADENETQGDLPVLRLKSQFGLAAESAADLGYVPIAGTFLEGIFNTKQPLSIADIHSDATITDVMSLGNVTSLAILPLFSHSAESSQILGCLCLARRELNPYSADELIRLTAIAEQIAVLIDSDRRRQLAIVLSERERLMRDLHDSVSQKLYGLVTLTEAAQAGLEAGSKVVPSQVLARIGENARQAVKEMRLFLYQMQPVDLEQDGLVTVLHHRLAAVEGRADIQARLLADEEISIPKDKEVALYYIAQEALNNVLKHAHAHTVLVTLKQTRQSVVLEVVDDGRGFDVKNVEQGGMGLQNMKVRTSQVNGKLKIVSQPGSGTKVLVKVSREPFSVQAKNR